MPDFKKGDVVRSTKTGQFFHVLEVRKGDALFKDFRYGHKFAIPFRQCKYFEKIDD